MAMGFQQKKKMKKNKNRQTKKFLVFDDQARMEYLTGFRKRKNERRKKAAEEKSERLKEEKREWKRKRKELLIKSQNYTGKKGQQLPEIESEIPCSSPVVHDLPSHTVTITDISEVDLAGQNGLRLGQNVFNEENESEKESENEKVAEKQTDVSLKRTLKKAKRKHEETLSHPRKKLKKQNFSHSQDVKFKRKRKLKINPKERRKIKKR